MTFGQAISSGFANLTNFEGRASRPAFWWWALGIFILNFVVSLLFGNLRGGSGGFFWLLGWLISIVLALATIAVGCRRMHDTGKSGWYQLLFLIPCVGWVIAIVLLTQPGTSGDNAYGPQPAA